MRLGAPIVTAIASLVLVTGAAAEAHGIPFVVDGVRAVAESAANGVVLSGQPGDATQETTIVDRAHQRSFSVIAIPYGTRAGVEDALPVAHRGGRASIAPRCTIIALAWASTRCRRPSSACSARASRATSACGTRTWMASARSAARHDGRVGDRGRRPHVDRQVRAIRRAGPIVRRDAGIRRRAWTDRPDGRPSALGKPTTVRKDTGASASPRPSIRRRRYTRRRSTRSRRTIAIRATRRTTTRRRSSTSGATRWARRTRASPRAGRDPRRAVRRFRQRSPTASAPSCSSVLRS